VREREAGVNVSCLTMQLLMAYATVIAVAILISQINTTNVKLMDIITRGPV